MSIIFGVVATLILGFLGINFWQTFKRTLYIRAACNDVELLIATLRSDSFDKASTRSRDLYSRLSEISASTALFSSEMFTINIAADGKVIKNVRLIIGLIAGVIIFLDYDFIGTYWMVAGLVVFCVCFFLPITKSTRISANDHINDIAVAFLMLIKQNKGSIGDLSERFGQYKSIYTVVGKLESELEERFLENS